MKVKWKTGSRLTCCTPTQAYRFFKRVMEDSDGVIDIEKAIHWSKPKDAPLHNALTWSKDEALKKVQYQEMRYAIRSVEVVRDDIATPVRAFESVQVEVIDDEKPEEKPKVQHIFRTVEDQLKHPDYRAQLLSQAVRDALAFRKRYAALSELATLIQVIDEVVPELAEG